MAYTFLSQYTDSWSGISLKDYILPREFRVEEGLEFQQCARKSSGTSDSDTGTLREIMEIFLL